MMVKPMSYESKVDVVPVINVSLVVVLTLMLISPFLNAAEEVDLPEANASEVDDQDNIEITLTLDRQIYIGEIAVELKEVRPILSDMLDGAPDAVAVVKADKALLYGEVEKLIAEVEKADAPRIAIATRQKRGEDS